MAIFAVIPDSDRIAQVAKGHRREPESIFQVNMTLRSFICLPVCQKGLPRIYGVLPHFSCLLLTFKAGKIC